MASYGKSDEKLLDTLVRSTARTKIAWNNHEKAETAQHVTAGKQDTFSALQKIGKSGNLEIIVAAEKHLVKHDLDV